MKKTLSLLVISAAIASCQDKDKLPAPAITSVALVKATAEAGFSSLDRRRSASSNTQLANLPDPTRPVAKITFDLYRQRDVQVNKVFIYKSLRLGSVNSPRYSPRVLMQEVTTFPSTLMFSSQELLAGLHRPGTEPLFITSTDTIPNAPSLTPVRQADGRNLVFFGEAIVLTYEYEVTTAKGPQRIILTPVSEVTYLAPTQQKLEVAAGTQINSPFALVIPFD